MDPTALAAAAVGLLVPMFKRVGGALLDKAGSAISDEVQSDVRALYERVSQRLSGDEYNTHLLRGVMASPNDPTRQKNLQQAIAGLVEQDAGFGTDLADLVGRAKGAGAVVIATNSGATAGGNVIQIAGHDATGRDKTSAADDGG